MAVNLNRLLKLAASTAPTYEDREDFRPWASPRAILGLGVFDGCYFEGDDPDVRGWPMSVPNLFAPKCGMSREQWRLRGWMHEDDPLGWFQWYVRFHAGRRHPDDDRQIDRWRRFGERKSRLVINGHGNPLHRPRDRQGLLHWAHDPMPDLKYRH